MRTNRLFILAGALAATLYFAPTKDPASAPKDAPAATKAASSTCFTNESFETGAVRLGVARTNEWTTNESIE
jgi:hypothetical protein